MGTPLQGFDPKATYSAAAEDYVRAARRYWGFLSSRTVERLGLVPGERVLDVACGSGHGVVDVARRVGPTGSVVGVDYAEGMLAVARRAVAAEGLPNVELVAGDMRALPYHGEFDAVMCVLGLFFVDDMAAAARSLWGAVRPGGRLAVTTFGTEVWTPVLAPFLDRAAAARPDIERVVPWRRTEDPAVLERALGEGGVPDVGIETEIVDIPFAIEDWRTIVMGSGLRRIATDLDDRFEEVLADTERWIGEQRVSSVRVSINFASARRGAS
jgi:SAM-dependent methyltransferase